MDGSLLDINVHPTKMDLRFADNEKIYRLICEGIRGALTRRELIPNVSVGREASQKEEKPRAKETEQRASLPEPFEKKRRDMLAEPSGGYLEGEKTIPVLKPSPIRQETKKESRRFHAPACRRQSCRSDGTVSRPGEKASV